MKVPRIVLGGCCVVALAAYTKGQTDESSKKNVELVSQFSKEFRSTKIKSYQQSADFGRSFIAEHPSIGFGDYVLSLLSDSDSRLRHAALSAAAAATPGDPKSAILLKRGLFDVDVRNRAASLDLIQRVYRMSLEMLEPVIDVMIHDADRTIRRSAGETLELMLAALPETRSEPTRPVLEQIRTDLDVQIKLSRDSSEALQLQAIKQRINNNIERLVLTQAAAKEAEVTKRPLPRGLSRFSAWITERSKSTFAALAIAALFVLTHTYYLLLFGFRPHVLFTYLYGRYPVFVIPYLVRPDIYKRAFRPALGLVTTLRNPQKAPRYLEYTHWLPIAAPALASEDRAKLSAAIASALQHVTDEGLKTSLFSALSEIDPALALRMMDLKPEDPEIRAARDNMSKIMDLPRDVFDRAGIELAHALKQATTISGDFYNVLTRASDSYAIYMVDVNYHGLPASLDAMQVCFALKAARDWGTRQPRLELEAADELIRDMGSDLWVNMNFLEIDLANRRARYSSAGMPPALLFRKTHPEPRRMMAVGQYIGSGYSFVRPEPIEVDEEIGGGDLIVLCSDGILESRPTNSNHPFGESRLIATVKTFRDKHVNDIVRAIVDSCKEYSGRARPQDDQSVVVIRIKDDLHSSSEGPAMISRSLNVSVENELTLRATVRREADWPKAVNQFVEEHALVFAKGHLDIDGAQRYRIALQEVLYNSVRHGTERGEYVSIEITHLPGRRIEATVTQQRDWPEWDVNLGARRRRELSETTSQMRFDPHTEARLGGATLIASFADEIICKGRRLSLRFNDRAREGGTHDRSSTT